MNEIWPHLDNLLTSRGIKAEINAKERIITVATTEKTRDPYVIIRARDMVKLISRSVPFVDARRVVTGESYLKKIFSQRTYFATSLKLETP